MEWQGFLEIANNHFIKAPDEVRLGYRFGGHGEAREVSKLDCAADWDTAVKKIREKALAARKRAVSIELKNMVSCALST